MIASDWARTTAPTGFASPDMSSKRAETSIAAGPATLGGGNACQTIGPKCPADFDHNVMLCVVGDGLSKTSDDSCLATGLVHCGPAGLTCPWRAVMWTGIAGVASLVFQCVIRALAHCILPDDDDKEGQDDQGARKRWAWY